MDAQLLNEPPLRAASGAQAPVTWIEVNSARLAAMRRGKGTPVLCLHAIGHGARDFEVLAQALSGEFEIVALDWPGQGLSPPDGTAPTAMHYAALALATMDALKLERVVLIGNSIGGAAALHVAATAPERVTGLVLCNTGGLAPVTPFVRFIIRRMATFFDAGARGVQWFAPAFRFYYRRLVLPRAPARAQRERIVASAYEIAPVLRNAWKEFAAPESDLRALAPKIGCPVLFAWAKSDRIIAWSRSRKAALKIPNRQVEFFRGGHAAFLEDPERFVAAFRRFAASAGGQHNPTSAPP